MRFEFLPDQNFECTACARCCRGWNVHVDPHTLERIRHEAVVQEVSARLGRPALEETAESVTTAQEEGSCSFLDARNLCSLHGRLGRENKPLGCRQFPFLIRPTPEGVQVSISFSCTSARENRGRPLSTYEGEIRELLEQWSFKRVGEEPVRVGEDRTVHWSEYLRLEGWLREGLATVPPMLAVGRCLVGVCRWLTGGGDFAARLEEAQVGPFPRDEVVASMEAFFLASLIGTLEVEGEGARSLTEALLQGGPVHLRRFGWEGSAEDLARYASAASLPWVDAEIVRYLEALLFVKFPALDRTVLDNLSLLYLLPPLLRWYTCAAALARGAAAPEIEDWYSALDVSERELVTHGRGLDRLYAAFGRAFREQVAP